MSEMTNNRWIVCKECGHKLFKLRTQMPKNEVDTALDMLEIEIKCHSCKKVNEVTEWIQR